MIKQVFILTDSLISEITKVCYSPDPATIPTKRVGKCVKWGRNIYLSAIIFKNAHPRSSRVGR